MITVIIQGLSALFFVASTIVLGRRLRRCPDKELARKTDRINRLLFYNGIVFPAVLGIFYPGLTRFDALLGISQLPNRPVAFIVGAVLFGPGLYLMSVSRKTLSYLRKGAPASKMAMRLVEGGIYNRVRNPRALGFYLTCVGVGLMVGSSYVTLVSLLVVIPAHIFNLKYLEELELELRLGEAYIEYKQRVPFMIPRRKGPSKPAGPGKPAGPSEPAGPGRLTKPR
jgi:protein-S-isoprenylcysteine O-methyltransferase Ste14